MKKSYNITPVGKPRMTQRDRWKKRPATARYYLFKDECRLLDVELPESAFHVHFILPMPKSWSKKKKAEMLGKPHKQKPDVDNMVKALLDAIYDDDSHVSDLRSSKWWGDEGRIVVENIDIPEFPL